MTPEKQLNGARILLARACDGDFWNPTYRDVITVGHAESILEAEEYLASKNAPTE